MRENLVAVASPALGEVDWRRHTLLQQSTRPYAWRDWFASRGMRVDGDMSGPRFELFSMATGAAIHGLGVALIPRFLVEDELRRGVLVEVVGHAYLNERSYYLIYPEGKSENAALATFRGWLGAQAKQYSEAMGLD
jgi:DNA-binding transcriptional LysR family regulator